MSDASLPPVTKKSAGRSISLRWWWLAAAIVAVGIGVVMVRRDRAPASSHGSSKTTQSSGQNGGRLGRANQVQPVSLASVEQRDIRVIVSAIGNIAAANTAVVHAKVDGELKAIYFVEGQPVRTGQLLAQIDPQSFQIELTLA